MSLDLAYTYQVDYSFSKYLLIVFQLSQKFKVKKFEVGSQVDTARIGDYLKS